MRRGRRRNLLERWSCERMHRRGVRLMFGHEQRWWWRRRRVVVVLRRVE
jgi:hypothetical protein